MGFESTIFIQVQTCSQVTEVYSVEMNLKTHALLKLSTGYNLGTNGIKGDPFQRTYTGTLKYWC